MRFRLWHVLYSLLLIALLAIPANANAWAVASGNAIDAEHGSYRISAPASGDILRADAPVRVAGLKSERAGETDGPLPGLLPEESLPTSVRTAIGDWHSAPLRSPLQDRAATGGPRAPPAI